MWLSVYSSCIRPILIVCGLSGVFISTACREDGLGTGASSFVMARTGEPLTDDTEIISSRPVDDGSSFRIGYGYDRLSGKRFLSCLDSEKYQLIGRNLMATESEMTIVDSKEHLATVLDMEINVECSLILGFISGGYSSKTKILREATFDDRSIVALMKLSHRAQEIGIDSSYEVLSDDSIALLKANPQAFRLTCGDAYTRRVATGGSIYILLNLTSNDSDIHNRKEVSSTIKAGLGGIFSTTINTNTINDLQRALSSFQVSAHCTSQGITADACGQTFSNASGDNLVAKVTSYLNSTREKALASFSHHPEKFVAIEEGLENYEKPINMTGISRDEIFYDYRLYDGNVQLLLLVEKDGHARCRNKNLSVCSRFYEQVAEQLYYCSRQDQWVDCDAHSVGGIYSAVIDATTEKKMSIGVVTLYEHREGGVTGGKQFIIDFDREDGPNQFKPDQIYDLGDWDWNDLATSYHTTLSAGWQLRMFEHHDGGGRCYMIRGGNRVFNFGWYNDKATSFRLERVGDYPNSC